MPATVFRLMLDSSVRAILVAAGVGVVLLVARARPGGVCHAAWSAVLAAMLLMPVLPRHMPSISVPLSAPEIGILAAPVPPLRDEALADRTPASSPVVATPPDTRPAAAVDLPPAEKTAWWLVVLLGLYGSGVLLLAGRLVAGWFATRTVRRTSSPVVIPGDHRSPVGALIKESPLLATAVTVGILTPRILLPSAWHEWAPQKLEAILAHELAHVRRRDALVALAARLNVCLFWFHPLAWWLEKRLAADAEHACDDAGARAIGGTRRYAEVLLDMAETVRRAGGRVAWQGVGVHGSGLLGKRIDRILRGDFMREVSTTRKLAVAVGSALAICLALACQQRAMPLKPDPRSQQEAAQRKADIDLLKAARAMDARQVRELHAAWKKNPEDMTALRKLLVFYGPYMTEAPSDKGKWIARCTLVIPEADCIAARREVIGWLVEHHPEARVAGQLEAHIYPTGLDALPDPAGYAHVKSLWLAQAGGPDADAAVLRNAANFFWTPDKPLAEQMLLRGRTKQPDPEWSRSLGSLYGLVLVGSNSSMPMGVVRSVSTADQHGAYAEQVRRKLAESTDAVLLTAAGQSLILRAEGVKDRLDFDPTALGASYLERAMGLNPDLVPPRATLWWLQERGRYAAFRARVNGLPPEKEREAVAALPEGERLAVLPMLARNAYARADYLKNEKHDEAGVRAAWEQARAYAEDMLEIAARAKADPRYATAVFHGNTVLGLVTYRQGGPTWRAVKYAEAASRAPATDALRYDSVWELRLLLRYLVREGERESVVECLERMAKINLLERDSLLHAADSIRHGVMPEYWDRMD
ncbi:MAG: M56 family metallopeptidase [Bacteroidales bacterium]